MTHREDWHSYIRKLRRENASLRRRLRAVENNEKIRSIHMTQNPTPEHQQLQERIEHLEHDLNIANIKAAQYAHLLVDHYGFDVDNPPPHIESNPTREFARNVGRTITATLPGALIEDQNEEPVAVSPTITTTDPAFNLQITPRDLVTAGIDPTTPGLTIVDPENDYEVVRRNPLEED